MDNENSTIAVLIDADNTILDQLELMVREISVYGNIGTKRAYGDWSNSKFKNWKDKLNDLAILAVQQFSYTSKKNSTDIRMVIDGMDLLQSDKYDIFVLVSSDSDFTPLAIRFKEEQKKVIGVGESKTPKAFVNACDEFINISNLVQPTEKTEIKKPHSKTKTDIPKTTSKKLDNKHEHLIEILVDACNKYAEDDGWANVAACGSYIRRLYPDFDARNYYSGSYTKIPALIKHNSDIFESKLEPGKGNVNVFWYRVLNG